MKICAAQTKPVKGDIETNIINHKKMIEAAIKQQVEIIVFPELSLTGYEPELAEKLATYKDDNRFGELQVLSNDGDIVICAGMPLRHGKGIKISMIIFQPNKPRTVYSKEYLHADELPYFVAGENTQVLAGLDCKIAFAICYEISVAAHADNAFKNGAKLYIASVAKSPDGVEKAILSLQETAKKYKMHVIMANCVGHCDNFDCGGKSMALDNHGELISQLNENEEGLLVYETSFL